MKNLQKKKNLFLKRITFYTLTGSFILAPLSYLPFFKTIYFQNSTKYSAQFDSNNYLFNQNKNVNLKKINLTNVSNVNRPEISQDIYGIKIIEKSLVKNHLLENTEFFLGHEGLKILVEKIKTRTGIGPEFFDLNEIILTQSGALIAESTNGWYNPLTHQIVLNFSGIMNYFNNNWTNRHQYFDDITEVLYQTFYHEYGHHIFNIYLTNFDQDKNLNQDLFVKLYRGNKLNRFYEPWNYNFIKSFKVNLNYEKDGPFLEDEFVKNFQGKEIRFANGAKLKSLATIYNPKMLFDFANNENFHIYSEFFEAQKLNPQTYYTWVANVTKRSNWPGVNTDYLRYVYQITELLTRKYMQLTFPFKTTRLISSDGMFNPIFNAPVSTTYLGDTRMYQEELNSSKQFRFLSDAPLKNDITANNLIDLLKNQVGQKRSENISFIWNYSDVKAVEKNDKIEYKINGSNVNKVKFGGFLNSVQDHYKYIGYFDHQYFRAIPITIYDYSYNRLPYLGASQRVSLNDGAKKFYVTNYNYSNDWIDVNFLDNQQLFFATDNQGNNATPLKSSREINKTGPVWTKRYHNIYEKYQQNAYAMVVGDNYSLRIKKKIASF